MNLTGRIKNVLNKFTRKSRKSVYDYSQKKFQRASDSTLGALYDFEPKRDILSDEASANAQSMVWDTEDASLQDQSYAFDEETTEADYNFEEDEFGSGQESRYS